MIDGKILFDQLVKNNKVTNENIRNIATGKGDDYANGCFLAYIYFKNYCKINFTENLDRAGNTRIYFILEEGKETVSDFSPGTVTFCESVIKYNLIEYNFI